MTTSSTGDDRSDVLHFTHNQLFYSTPDSITDHKPLLLALYYLQALNCVTTPSTGEDKSDVLHVTCTINFFYVRIYYQPQAIQFPLTVVFACLQLYDELEYQRQ